MAIAETSAHPPVPAIAESVKTTLAASIQSKFDQVMGNDDADDVAETPAEDAAETAEETVTGAAEAETKAKEDEPAAEDADPADEQTTTTEAGAAAATTGKTPTLPAAYVRSLKAYDWTDEEIAEAARTPGFLNTAAKIHANRNKEVQAWAEAGRKAKGPQGQAATSQTNAHEAVPQQSLPEVSVGLKPVDAKALKAQYGDEALIDAIVGPVNATIEQINRMLPVVQSTQHRAQMAQAEMLGRQIDGFFGGKELAPYKDTYGTETAKLSNEQLAARTKVLEFADALVGGAMQQGRSLSFDEAMQLAHDATSGGQRTQAARQQITQQIQKRSAGLTLKPGSRGSSLKTGPAQNRTDLQKRVQGGLKAVFG